MCYFGSLSSQEKKQKQKNKRPSYNNTLCFLQFFLFLIFVCLFEMHYRYIDLVALYLLYRPSACKFIHRSTCLCLPRVGIIGMYHWVKLTMFSSKKTSKKNSVWKMMGVKIFVCLKQRGSQRTSDLLRTKSKYV